MGRYRSCSEVHFIFRWMLTFPEEHINLSQNVTNPAADFSLLILFWGIKLSLDEPSAVELQGLAD